MSAEDGIIIENNSTYLFSEPQLARIIYEIVKMLCDKNLVSGDPLKIQIQRTDREPIHPCGRSHGPDVLNMSQLAWAAEQGHFWFLGSIKSLDVVLDKGSTQGYLEGTPKRTTLTTSVNRLNFEDWEKTARHMKKTSEQLGLQIYFEELPGSHSVVLKVSVPLLLSAQNVSVFLEKVGKLMKLL